MKISLGIRTPSRRLAAGPVKPDGELSLAFVSKDETLGVRFEFKFTLKKERAHY